MAVHFDTKSSDLAAEILRDAVQLYGRSDIETWLSGYNPVLTAWNADIFNGLEVNGAFRAATGSSPPFGWDSDATSRATLKLLFRLPDRLPAVRLPPAPELSTLARSAPIMVKLEELARWLGRDGRPVTQDYLLHDGDAADAAHWLGIRPDLLSNLWENALVTEWFEVLEKQDRHRRRAVLGKTAYYWAAADVPTTLQVWAMVFASVLAITLEVAASHAPEAARRLNFQGQGVALAVMLFLARRTGLTKDDASDIVRDGAIGDPSTGRDRKAWDAWVHRFGDPARRLLDELAALRALVPPSQDDNILALSPLAQWALWKQFKLDDVSIRIVPASGELSVADLVELSGGVRDTEFNAEVRAWLSRRNPHRAARDLLMYALSAEAGTRLTAVNLVRRIGPAARGAWLEAMRAPQLRGYARIALSTMAADLPKSRQPMAPDPNEGDLDCVAVDLLTLIGQNDDPAPGRVAMWSAEAIPVGEERRVFALLARSTHPDAKRLLKLLGNYHPDRDIAREARRAVRASAKKRSSVGHPRIQSHSGQATPSPIVVRRPLQPSHREQAKANF